MCGFAGLLGPPGPPEARAAAARQMAATLVHRGPDDEGAWADPSGEVALGFRRLSIIDLSAAGHQPMTSADGRYTIVFNGEVYNFAALRRDLEAKGHRFRGHSDTEVVLTAFMQLGVEATLPRLRGMYAFAAWDGRERVLHLVRDRLGKKPLYYGWQGSTLLFGSELKALRAHPAFSAPIDRDALASYLRFCYVPAARSIYQQIHKLPPAGWVTLRGDRPGVVPPVKPYWDAIAVAVAGERDPLRLADAEAVDALDAVLREAVQLRAVADVPVGALLSGGIDSSTVVALLQAESTRRVRTFTIGYGSRQYDESAHARAIAAHLGTDHTELCVTPEEARVVIPRLPTLFDEPFADSSQIPTSLVSTLARQQVTVALSGDGGDELFGGYRRHFTASRVWPMLEKAPRPLRRACAHAMEAISPAAWDRAGAVLDALLPSSRRGLLSGHRAHKVASVLGVADMEDLYRRLVSTWPEPGDVVQGGTELPAGASHAAAGALRSPAHRMMLLDLLGYLPDDILVKVDRASMGASLEVRAPFLDHVVAEFAWRLPITQKIRGGTGKWLVRRVLERHVPRELFERPKQGFGVPIDEWLRGPLREWAQDLLSEERLRREGFFKPEPVLSALREHLDGKYNRQYQLWNVLMFQAWHSAHSTGGAQS